MLRKPFFLPSQQGDCFCLLSTPNAGTPIQGSVLIIPPFAEELNQSRRAVSLLSRDLTEQGYAVLMLDLFGTGDSAGDFEAATWSGWVHDTITAMTYLTDRFPVKLSLMGIRMGALLALEAIATCHLKPQQMVTWHPVWEGQQQLREFLRLLVAKNLASGQPQPSVSTLKQTLLQQGQLDVSGYTLSATLMHQMDQASAQHHTLSPGFPIQWIEATPTPLKPRSSKNQAAIDALTAQGAKVSFKQLETARPFLSTDSIEEHDALRALTLKAFS